MDQEGKSIEEYREHLSRVKDEIKAVDTEYAGRELDPEAREKFEALKVEREKTEKLIKELEERKAYIDELSGREENLEPETPRFSFQTRRPATRVPDDPTKLEDYRVRATSLDDLQQGYRDGARSILERSFRTSHPAVSREEAQQDIDKLIDIDNEIAVRMIATSSPNYRREFATYVKTGSVGPEMTRAASLTTTAGGFAVPVELDTSLLLTNAGAVNPIRRLARLRQTNVNHVEFVNTAGITAGYAAEATEASDNAPTLAQPVVDIEKAFAFVPMSIEIAQDWDNIQPDMAMAFADAKNRIESTKFLKGLGHSSHEPQGLLTAATAITSTASTAVFAVGDLFNLEIALSPRYRNDPSCAIVGNKATFQKVRQFASNGVNIWVQLQGAVPPELIGYPAYEWSDYDSTPTTSGSTILTIGAFNYFAIVERAGLNIELVPHIFGSSNRYPLGQRGLYCWWRNSSQVLSPTLSANSAFQSLKVL